MDQLLTDVVVVNESKDERTPGDISIFRSASDACRYLEPWWIEDAEGFAFTAAGERLTLEAAGTAVFVVGKEVVPDGPEIVRSWLRAAARAVFVARHHRARRGKPALSAPDEVAQIPTSTEALIDYVGFTR